MVREANMINYLIEVIIQWEVKLLVVRCLGRCKREQDGAFQFLYFSYCTENGGAAVTAHSLDYEHL